MDTIFYTETKVLFRISFTYNFDFTTENTKIFTKGTKVPFIEEPYKMRKKSI